MKKAIVSVSVCLIMAMVLSTGCQKAASVQSDKKSETTKKQNQPYRDQPRRKPLHRKRKQGPFGLLW